jgi:hypothetical protein
LTIVNIVIKLLVRFEIKSKPKQRRVKMYNECLIDEVSYKGYRIKTYQDDEPDNPRDWDNLGKIFYGHKRYVLGEVDVRKEFEDCYSWDDVEKRIIELYDPLVILPLYLYDHSVLRIKIGDFYDSQLPQGYAYFDTGMVGFVIAERDKVRKEYGVQRISKKLREQVKQILEDEIDVFDKYLSGQVYAYSIEDTDIACSGFYDYDEMVKYAKEEVDGIQENIVITTSRPNINIHTRRMAERS